MAFGQTEHARKYSRADDLIAALKYNDVTQYVTSHARIQVVSVTDTVCINKPDTQFHYRQL